MIDSELLDILVCPDTKQPVHPAGEALLERLNAAIARGEVETRSGETVERPVTEGLVREDGGVLYPVRDDIPVMLVDQAIVLEGLE